MTNVKFEIVCEVDGKRYRFVENTWKEYLEGAHCERRCAFYKKEICHEIFCHGIKCGNWEEIK